MAPIGDRSRAVVLAPLPGVHQATGSIKTLKMNQFQEAHFEPGQKLPVMRCSSVSSDTDEETDYPTLLQTPVVIKNAKTRLVTCYDRFTSNPNNTWAGVTSGLEEEERNKKIKVKFPWGGEEKKYAVENDDVSSSLAFNSSRFEHRFECEKFVYTAKAIQFKLKVENPEAGRKWSDDSPLVVPYSIQETQHATEAGEEQNEQISKEAYFGPAPSPHSPADVISEEDLPSIEDDRALVQVDEELSLDVNALKHEKVVQETKQKQKHTLRRHAIKKVKRSIWCVIQPEPPTVQCKRKKTSRPVNTRKQKQQSAPRVAEANQPSTAPKQPSKKHKKRKIPSSPVIEEPNDCGVASNGEGSQCGDGSDSSSGGSSSSGSSETNSVGGSAGQKNGSGAGGGDDGEGWKRSFRHLPGEKDHPVPNRDKREEEDRDGCSQEKMELGTSQRDSLWHPPGEKDEAVPDREKDKGDDEDSCSQEKMELDICQQYGTEESCVQQSQGVGNHGYEGEKGKKKPWWYLPGEKDVPVPDRDKEKEDDRSGCSKEKMEVKISQDGFPMFLPSKVDNAEQCHGPGRLAMFAFIPSDLQHGCYCSNQSCSNTKCSRVKAEVNHMKTHEDWVQCLRCKYTGSVVQEHAKTCRRSGCRIPYCETMRKGHGDKGNIAKPKPYKAPLVPMQLPHARDHEALMGPTFYQRSSGWDPNHLDGKVIFRNTTLIPEDYFQEHTNYNVVRKALGAGSFGNVYRVYLQSDRSKEVVVKETTYKIKREEVEIYKRLGDHKHIVKHLGGTFRGTKGCASIFMDLCDDSLYNYMEKMRRRLSVEEAMFCWLQIREAVDYLHRLDIIHKDIKAKNVLMKEGRFLLADFDSAKLLANEVTEKGLARRGTQGFVSPEVLACEPHGRPADIFGMGCFLIEMIMGPPVNNTLHEKIDMLSELDFKLAQLVKACVSERPEDRPTARSLLGLPVVKKYSSGA